MIDTQSIRTKILDLAMRGRLTEQLPEDGTAEELYQQIQVEKQALIKAGKIKKEKPLPEITEGEKPFEIPESWKWVYLGELFQHNTGKALNASDRQGELLEYITTSNLYWDRFELDDLKQMPFTESEIEKCTVKKGDLLVCEGGDIGRSAIWPFDYEMRIQNHIHRLRRYSSGIYTEFYYYLLWLYKQTGRINGIEIGLQGFSSKRVHSLIVPLAPYAEAIRVAETIKKAFSTLDTIDELQTKYADNLTVLKSKLIDAAIQGKLTEQLPEDGTAEELYQQIQEEKQALIKAGKIKKEKPLPEITESEIPFEIPANWKWCRIGDIVSFNPRHMALDDGLPVSFIPMPRVLEGYNNRHSSEERVWKDVKTGYSNFCDGDVGVAKITPCFQNRKSVVFRNLLNGVGAGTTEFTVMRPIGSLVHPDYLLWFCKSDGFIKKGVESFNGSVGQARVDKDYMKMCLLPLPPQAEQKRIVARLDQALAMIEV